MPREVRKTLLVMGQFPYSSVFTYVLVVVGSSGVAFLAGRCLKALYTKWRNKKVELSV